MNKLLLCFCLVLAGFTASSQKVYFVYLQSEQEQPFFVKMNEKIYSSSASGYLILSRLKDSTYDFSVGFPQNKWPEQRFSLTVRGKDQGHILKNFGDKGWGLFNLQSLAVQMAIVPNSGTSIRMEKADVSPFMDILARAADDSSLKNKPVYASVETRKPEPEKVEPTAAVVKEEPKPVAADKPMEKTAALKTETVNQAKPDGKEAQQAATQKPAEKIAEAKAETTTETKEKDKQAVADKAVEKPVEPKPEAVIQAKAEVKEEQKPDISKDIATEAARNAAKEADKTTPVPYKSSVVKKVAETKTPEGVSVSFVDDEGGAKDSITILIPEAKQVAAVVREQPKEEKKFLDISAEPEKTKTADTVAASPADRLKQDVIKPLKGNNCKQVAVDADFLKLRKNMAAETDDDDMVDEARKYFRSKCFTTAQIKNLSTLFLDDLGKYKFFDMAYIFVSDQENFPSLQNELKNEYYINRFKAMLK